MRELGADQKEGKNLFTTQLLVRRVNNDDMVAVLAKREEDQKVGGDSSLLLKRRTERCQSVEPSRRRAWKGTKVP
jgi:hypothetical protein